MSNHFQEVCEFGSVHSQCRCPSPTKHTRKIPCPTPAQCERRNIGQKKEPMYKKRKAVTVDLDSTLCDTGHRHRLIDRVNGTDWNAYSLACSDDSLIVATETMIRIYAEAGYEIHYVTGRSHVAYDATVAWLRSHNLPIHGLWMDDTEDNDHIATHGSHGAYKVSRVQQVAREVGEVVLHIDDWAEVKVMLEEAGIPCLCVRTPQEVTELTSQGVGSLL